MKTHRPNVRDVSPAPRSSAETSSEVSTVETRWNTPIQARPTPSLAPLERFVGLDHSFGEIAPPTTGGLESSVMQRVDWWRLASTVGTAAVSAAAFGGVATLSAVTAPVTLPVAAVGGVVGGIGGYLGFGGGQEPEPPGPMQGAEFPTPAQVKDRLVEAEEICEAAVASLPNAIKDPWPQQETVFVLNTVRPAVALVHGLAAFPNDDAALTSMTQAAQIETQAEAYRDYCAAIESALETTCDVRQAYQDHLTVPTATLFTNICTAVRAGNQSADQTRTACRAFNAAAQADSAMTSDGLYALMQANRGRAERLVAEYFARKRLRINKWRIGYATENYDWKSGAFGAEWTLRTGERELKDIADKWVFHTHAKADVAGNIEISRTPGASHIKRKVDALVLGVSLNFVDDAEFKRIEKDKASNKAFNGWVRRTGGVALLNSKKRSNQ